VFGSFSYQIGRLIGKAYGFKTRPVANGYELVCQRGIDDLTQDFKTAIFGTATTEISIFLNEGDLWNKAR
jgi:hypothetical protein